MRWFDVCMTFFAIFGLFVVGWLSYGGFLLSSKRSGRSYNVLVAQGDGEDLEQTVRGILWMQSWSKKRHILIIIDDDLSTRGKQIANALILLEDHIQVCSKKHLLQFLE